MIDCSRHFIPLDVIMRTLNGMAAVKLNVFHWHLSDDQGFRIESKVFPKLTGEGSDGLFYTQEQAKEVVAYARKLGIRVVPEFDMPGHTTSWAVGYPELASGPGPFSIERHFGVFNPVLDPTKESTYQFIDQFVGEMATIFPDPYMHIGGDENNGVEWKENPGIQAFAREHNLHGTAAIQAYFNQRLLPILTKHGKKMIGWDEVLTPGLPKDVMVQSWRGFDSLAAGAKQGYSGILSAGYYLDHMDSTADHYRVDPVPANSNLTPGAGGAHPGRRGLHVERVRGWGHDRFAHLAENSGDRGAAVVATLGEQHRRHVPAAVGGESAAGEPGPHADFARGREPAGAGRHRADRCAAAADVRAAAGGFRYTRENYSEKHGVTTPAPLDQSGGCVAARSAVAARFCQRGEHLFAGSDESARCGGRP